MFTLEQQDNGGVCRITVAGEITVYSAAELKHKLLAAADGCASVECDLADVSDFDSAGVQLIELLRRQVGAGGKVRITAASEQVRELFELYRLSDGLVAPIRAQDDAAPQAGNAREAS